MKQRAAEETRMFAEAAEAPEVVARQLAANDSLVGELAERLRRDPPRGVVTYARGSSDHAATFAKYVLETRVGVLTTSAAPSIASVYGEGPDVSGMLALAISQSGKSPDILAAVSAAKSRGAQTVALVNAVDSPLADLCDVAIPLHAGAEQSVAATKSYIAALSALIHLASKWSGDGSLAGALETAPELLRAAWRCDWSHLTRGLAGVRGLFVVGRGPGFAIAQEAALKLKETCQIQAEAFSAAEVRHGPMALLGPGFPVLAFRQSDESGLGIDALVQDVQSRGAPVFIAGGDSAEANRLPVPSAHPLIEPMLQIAAFYRAANAISLVRGLDPDRPPHLTKVTETI
jgi:glucosamine--fructose-6-phosphate aminotransferase (isomerizing)